MKKFILCAVIALTLVGCTKQKEEPPKMIEVTVIGHEVKNILKDDSFIKEYYIQVETTDRTSHLVKTDYTPPLIGGGFTSTFPIGLKLFVEERKLLPLDKQVIE